MSSLIFPRTQDTFEMQSISSARASSQTGWHYPCYNRNKVYAMYTRSVCIHEVYVALDSSQQYLLTTIQTLAPQRIGGVINYSRR